MMTVKLVVFLCVLGISASDWVSDWMSPVQDELLNPNTYRKINTETSKEDMKLMPYAESTQNPYYLLRTNDDLSTAIRTKLQATLDNANRLAHTLNAQITELAAQERTLKEAIVNGRSGVTTLMVHTIGQPPRSYLIREGLWTLCTGAIHPPVVEPSVLKGLFSTPRCFGQEVPTRPDACVFNSMIKYETIPTRRRSQYVEDDYLCLKPNFNDTLEQYFSVPRRVINMTCTEGYIRSLNDNQAECGIRVLSDYTFYPHRLNSPQLPLQYCTEEHGSCKLIVAWHVSNASIENFEFMKNEPNFKNYFIKEDSYRQRVI